MGNYIMNTFECRNHGIDTSSTLDTSVNSTIGHFSKHLKKSKKVSNAVKVYVCSWNKFSSNLKETNLLNRLVMVFWVHKLGDTKFLGCGQEQRK
jgi:hypothetical protein